MERSASEPDSAQYRGKRGKIAQSPILLGQLYDVLEDGLNVQGAVQVTGEA